MSNVNKVHDRLYFVPQLGMFHSEIFDAYYYRRIYKCTLPVKSMGTPAYTL